MCLDCMLSEIKKAKYMYKPPLKDGHKCSLGPESQIYSLLVKSHVLHVVPFGSSALLFLSKMLYWTGVALHPVIVRKWA